MNNLNFECPWCGKQQTKPVPKGAEIEVRCTICKESIGIVTDDSGQPIRIGQLTSKAKLLEASHGKSVSQNSSAISIGNVYGNVSFTGDTITNVYNETIRLIEKTDNMKPEQKSQAKNILNYVKINASQFLPIVAEAIRKAFGL